MMVGAALMLGATGYALQGYPTMPARDANPNALAAPEDPAITDLRDRLFGRFTDEGAYMIAADSMERIGERRAAVQALLGGIRHHPRSAALWTALGTAYSVHDGGQVSPPSLFAFQQATRLAPDHPGPPFFLGWPMSARPISRLRGCIGRGRCDCRPPERHMGAISRRG